MIDNELKEYLEEMRKETKEQFDMMRKDMDSMKLSIGSMQQDIGNMQQDIGNMQQEMDNMKNNFKELANQMHEYYQINEPTALETTSINQINWHNFSYTGSFGTTYYYLMNKEDKVFKLEFEIEEDATTDCLSYKDEIINSIIIK